MLAPLELEDPAIALAEKLLLEMQILDLKAQLAQTKAERDAALARLAACRWCQGEFR